MAGLFWLSQEAPAEVSSERVAFADATVQLDRLTVSGQQDASQLEGALRSLHRVPSSVSLIDSSVIERGRVGTAADVLAFQPGVFAQSTGGQDALRVSIRGSGLNRGQGSFREGITFLFDGLAVTGPGGTPYELFEPLGLSYTEVLRGPAGFRYGALALGGAINYVTKTGFDVSPFELRFELGSFGYGKAQLSSGQVLGAADYYISLVGSERKGFQRLTDAESARVIGNLGYKVSDRIDTRFYLRFGATNFENPGSLTLAQLLVDPTQANPTNVAASANPAIRSTRLQQGSTWIGNKTTVRLNDDSSLEAGLVFHDYPIDIRGTQRSLWEHGDLNTSLRYIRSDEWGSRASDTTLGFVSSLHLYGLVDTYSDNTLARQVKSTSYTGSANHVLYAANDLEWRPGLWSNVGVQLINIRRENRIRFPVQREYTRDVVRVAPRVGLRYDVIPQIQVFGNLSRAVEPADSWKYTGSTITTGNGGLLTDFRRLRDQISDTAELGVRLQNGRYAGEVTVFRSWIKDELLNVQIDPGPPAVTANFNASRTVKQGLEVGFNVVLWQPEGSFAGAVSGAAPKSHRVSVRQAYTLNDFHYKGDSLFGKNELPGLPSQFFQGEVLYEHASGLYVGLSAQVSSSYFIDYANTFRAPSYTIYHGKIGYEDRARNWEIYLDFRNLTDEAYVTAISPIYTAGGRDNAAFQPGDGFSVFGGISYRY